MSALSVLVTGSSSGFGRLTAENLAKKGYQVFASMRGTTGKNEEKAKQLAAWAASEKVNLHIIDLDITNDASVDEGVARVLSIAGKIDVVVNNAGLLAVGLGEAFTQEQLHEVFNTNFFGPQRVNRAVLPAMRKAGAGLLLHVSTASARCLVPFMGVYAASKAALEVMAETYRYELSLLGIDSVLVEPGAFPTNLVANMLQPQTTDRSAEYGPVGAIAQQVGAMLDQILSHPNAPTPQLVVDAIVALIETPAGQRPLRTVVDLMGGPNAEALNETAARLQRATLQSMGMADLLQINNGKS
jgi:NAD(P)-dependent dehydrogenase (short-subunit alcohol dehydrogenase family)